MIKESYSTRELTLMVLEMLNVSPTHEQCSLADKSFRGCIRHNVYTVAINNDYCFIYFRITTFLQTLSLFISLSSDSKHRLPTNGLVRSPSVCSLPTVCRMLWRQVETVTRESDNKSVVS